MSTRRKTRPAPRNAGKSALILFAHGSRDMQWARPFRKIRRTILAKRPSAAVKLAFLEIMEPTLEQTVTELAAAGVQRITVAPLFMAQGAHLKLDLAKIVAAIRADHAGVTIKLLPAIGEVGEILAAISDWLVGAAQG